MALHEMQSGEMGPEFTVQCHASLELGSSPFDCWSMEVWKEALSIQHVRVIIILCNQYSLTVVCCHNPSLGLNFSAQLNCSGSVASYVVLLTTFSLAVKQQ